MQMETHSGEKQNKCNECAYACSQASELKNHLKNLTNATNMTKHFPGQAFWGVAWKHTEEGGKSNKCNQCGFAPSHVNNLKINVKTHSGKIKYLQPMWLFILTCRRFKETFDNAQWRKIKPLQPIWLSIQTFKDTFENRKWWKAQQMQPMCNYILTCRRFKETFEKDTFQKIKTLNAASVTIWGDIWQRTKEKVNTNATIVTMHLPWQAFWVTIWKYTAKKNQN